MFTKKYQPKFQMLEISLKVIFKQRMTQNQGWQNVALESKLAKEKYNSCTRLLTDFFPLQYLYDKPY